MLTVRFKPSFVRQVNKLSKDFQDEVIEKVELFKNPESHKFLKVHKLHGALKGCYSFSVDFSHRIVFEYVSQTEVTFLAIGNHDIYK